MPGCSVIEVWDNWLFGIGKVGRLDGYSVVRFLACKVSLGSVLKRGHLSYVYQLSRIVHFRGQVVLVVRIHRFL